jgi:tRNA-2-methylthio-N6-dimethylallyladenosine synthase
MFSAEQQIKNFQATAPAAADGRLFFHIITFGCQMNKSDSETIAGALAAAGFRWTDRAEDADVILINTCSVRDHAEHRAISRLGMFKDARAARPGFLLGVIGCMAQRDARAILRQAPHVRLVVGTHEYGRIAALVLDARAGKTPVVAVGEETEAAAPRALPLRETRFHGFLNVMKGCDVRCTYCVVPGVRGPAVSIPPDALVDTARRLAADGVRELTLLGQTVDAYGRDLAQPASLAVLLRRIAEVPGLVRIRFITSHPMFIDEPLLRAMAEIPQMVRFLHIPVQSGSDRVLLRMNRRCDRARFEEVVAMARGIMPDIGIASDVIVCFPGETDEDFAATESLVAAMRFQQCFAFKYSARPGTAAARWADDAPDSLKRERHARILALQLRIQSEDNAKMIGRDIDVMVDGPSKRDAGRWTGRARDWRIALFPPDGLSPGEIRRFRVGAANSLSLFCGVADNRRPV